VNFTSKAFYLPINKYPLDLVERISFELLKDLFIESNVLKVTNKNKDQRKSVTA